MRPIARHCGEQVSSVPPEEQAARHVLAILRWPSRGNRWHISFATNENRSNRRGGTARSVAKRRGRRVWKRRIRPLHRSVADAPQGDAPMAKAKPQERIRGHPRHVRVQRRALAPGLRHQHVLHVADEGREPQGLQGERGRVSQEVQADARADRRRPQARLQPHARARRQHLFHRQARRDRRPLVPAPRRRDDRLDAGGLCRDDAWGRPLGRRQPLEVGQVRQARARQAAAKPKAKKAAAKSTQKSKSSKKRK